MLQKKPRIRSIIIMLTISSVLMVNILILGVVVFFQKRNIEDYFLKSNYAYAYKLAEITDHYLSSAQRELAWSASQIHTLSDVSVMQNEMNRLRMSVFFNSVFVVSSGRILWSVPPRYPAIVDGEHFSDSNILTLSRQTSLISVLNSKIIFISHPLIAYDGRYLGYIGGFIYLDKSNVLRDILNLPFEGNDITVVLMDNKGQVIFSQNSPGERKKLFHPIALKTRLIANENGYFLGYDGATKSLIGYASLKCTDWHVFISTPTGVVIYMLMHAVYRSAVFIIGIFILTAGVGVLLSAYIANPLEQLARRVKVKDENSINSPEGLFAIDAWYQEANLLRYAIVTSFRSLSERFTTLSDEVLIDPLTGVFNRRGFNESIRHICSHKHQYVIAIDVDFFKSVNDRFGHSVGDEVLMKIADLLSHTCREGDIISRFGGEEFIILLPDSTLYAAFVLAERIRVTVDRTHFPVVGHITLSAGVAGLQECGGVRDLMLKVADQALYQAKKDGRNRVVLSQAPAVTDFGQPSS